MTSPSAVSTAMTVASRDELLEDMAEVTRNAAIEGGKKLQAGHQVAVMISYDLGTIINSVYNAEELDDSRKRQEIKKLAAYWNQPNLGPTTLYDLRNVAIAFTRDFVKAQIDEKMTDGGCLTWSHFKELQKTNSEKRQLALLKQIRKNCWSANELAMELQGKKEAEIKRGGGRPPTLPKTPNAMLQKLFSSVQLTDNYLSAVSDPLDGIFMEMSPDDVDSIFLDNIDAALVRMGEAQQHLKDTAVKLKKVRVRTVTVLKNQASSASAKADTKATALIAAKQSVEATAKPMSSTKSEDVKSKRGRPRRADVKEEIVVPDSAD